MPSTSNHEVAPEAGPAEEDSWLEGLDTSWGSGISDPEACGVPHGPVTEWVSEMANGTLGDRASEGDVDRTALLTQAAHEGTSCLDLGGMGDESALVVRDMLEMSKVPIGRELLESVSSDPHGDRVTFQPLAPGAGPATTSVEASAYQTFDSRDGVCTPLTADQPAGGNAIVRYAPGQEWGDGPEAWKPYSPDLTLFHELVHADHLQNGTSTMVKGDACMPPWLVPAHAGYHEENRTTGVAGYENERFSENAYREQRRALGEDVAHRDYYFKPE